MNDSFRLDINGLRAYAVALVVLYHFGVPGFGGGFVGVDVFFVISGYLMTTIIVKGLEAQRFHLVDFYLARARRIVPALAAVCATLLALGAWLLPAPDYKTLAAHEVYSLTFLSNIAYWQQAGYFDAASHDKWLLHTWSLSVEWQFYLLLPLLLWAVWRFRPTRLTLRYVLMALALLSLSASVFITQKDANQAFYLLHTRAWELLAGGLVGLMVVKPLRHARLLAAAGLVAILASSLLFDKATAWPGFLAVVPVAGAAAVIAAKRQDSALTAHPLAQRLGDMSYSIYLWHWPVVVAITYLGNQSTPALTLAGLVLTLLLGALSYRFIETPARFVFRGRGRWLTAAAGAALVLLLVAPALLVHRAQGVPSRLPAAVELAAREADNTNPGRTKCQLFEGKGSPSCLYGSSALGAIAVGDSHANALMPALGDAARASNLAVMEWSYTNCPTVRGTYHDYVTRGRANYSCTAFNEWVRASISQREDTVPVIIINRTSRHAIGPLLHEGNPERPVDFVDAHPAAGEAFRSEFRARLVETTCALGAHRPVYLMRPVPEMPVDVPKVLSRRLALGMSGEISISRADYQARHAFVWAAQDEAAQRCGAKILDPLPYLCDAERCYGSRQGRPLYHDDDHLSLTGGALLIPLFKTVFAGQ